MKPAKRSARADARRSRVLQLKRMVHSDLYYVPARTVAKAVMRQLGIREYAPAPHQR